MLSQRLGRPGLSGPVVLGEVGLQFGYFKQPVCASVADSHDGADTPEELETAEDKAFSREREQMTPATRKKLRDMKKLLDE